MKQQTSITLEKPDPTGHVGTSFIGIIAKAMLNTSNWTLLSQRIDNSELRSKIEQMVLNIAIILIINSDKKIRIIQYREFCQETYLLVASIQWIKFNPSAHIVLAPSPELIEENDNTGLLSFTE